MNFAEHFYYIGASPPAYESPVQDGHVDEETDLLRPRFGSPRQCDTPEGALMVGLLPLLRYDDNRKVDAENVFRRRWPTCARMRRLPYSRDIHPPAPRGGGGGHLGVPSAGSALVHPDRLRGSVTKMLDENEFLESYGIAPFQVSQQHRTFSMRRQEVPIVLLPPESNTACFGGNSNWRGPV